MLTLASQDFRFEERADAPPINALTVANAELQENVAEPIRLLKLTFGEAGCRGDSRETAAR